MATATRDEAVALYKAFLSAIAPSARGEMKVFVDRLITDTVKRPAWAGRPRHEAAAEILVGAIHGLACKPEIALEPWARNLDNFTATRAFIARYWPAGVELMSGLGD